MPHSMQRRSPGNNYRNPGFYHITINVHDRKNQSLGRITGDAQYPDGHPGGPKVELTVIGKMVEYELRHSITQHYPVILIADNGFPEIYHPSEARLQQCVANRLLLLTPWVYCYSPANEDITVAWCKAMNCFAQALCRTKDDWWKNTIDDCRSITPGGR